MPASEIPLDSNATPTKARPLNPFSANQKPNVETLRTQLRHDMEEKYICIPSEDFMNTYMPKLPKKYTTRKFQDAFMRVNGKKSPQEQDLYDPFVSHFSLCSSVITNGSVLRWSLSICF